MRHCATIMLHGSPLPNVENTCTHNTAVSNIGIHIESGSGADKLTMEGSMSRGSLSSVAVVEIRDCLERIYFIDVCTCQKLEDKKRPRITYSRIHIGTIY